MQEGLLFPLQLSDPLIFPLSDLLVFGKRAGEYAAQFAQENGGGKIDDAEVDALAKAALEPLERDGDGENPYEIQRELQEMMQDKVGIIREDGLMREAIDDIAKLGAPIAHVLTAESAGAYKPHMQAFEYMFDTLNCGPEDVLHVSSSFRYDLMTAHDLGITKKVWVNRGHEPANPYYGYTEVPDVSHLPAVLGL